MSGSLTPSVAEFKRTAAKVEKVAHSLAPFVLGLLTATGDKESIDFEPRRWKIVGTAFHACGLMGVGDGLQLPLHVLP